MTQNMEDIKISYKQNICFSNKESEPYRNWSKLSNMSQQGEPEAESQGTINRIYKYIYI